MKTVRSLGSLAISVIMCAFLGVTPRAAGAVEVGAPAPQFSLPDTKGTTHTLSEHRGKIVVLEWTNPTCPFVKRHYSAGTMKKLASKYAEKGVVWLAIDSSHFASAEADQQWIADHKLPYPILLDPAGNVGRAYGAKTTPHMFVVDKEGKIAYAGAIDDDPRGDKGNSARNYVDEVLAKLVSGEKPEISTTPPYGCSVKYKK